MDYTKPLQIKAYDSLKAMILKGHFKKGEIYSETKTSIELGISRTPMRDAVQRLAQEKYVDVIPSKGFRIHEMSEQDLIETYQIRCALEGFCTAQLAMNNHTRKAQKVIQSLENLVQNQKDVIDRDRTVEEFAPFDQKFHEEIVQYSENLSLIEVFGNYLYQIKSQMYISLHAEGRMIQTLEEHRRIVEAIKSGSLEKTYIATLAHLEKPKIIIQNMNENFVD